MIIGFDVYHGSGGSVNAMVSTTTPSFGSFYSTVSLPGGHRGAQEVSASMALDVSSKSQSVLLQLMLN
jgi:hypothetical protein